LQALRPGTRIDPNPDLFARRPRRRWFVPLAAAAMVALAAGWWAGSDRGAERRVARHGEYLRMNERRLLPDGSQAELKDGTSLEVCYSAGERRVRITGGEAQFSVMKDPSRPFVVEAGGVAVRAVGTVFDVRLAGKEVNVLVTEGKVRVGLAAQEPGRIFRAHTPENEPPTVAAGQRAVVALTEATPAPVVADVSTEEIRRDLAWQAPRLQFEETPLADAIAEFNRRNRHQLVLGDPQLATVLIGGTFRPDNVDGFVRLLAVTAGIHGVAHGPDETVLVRSR
jgi:transmembrane sensor